MDRSSSFLSTRTQGNDNAPLLLPLIFPFRGLNPKYQGLYHSRELQEQITRLGKFCSFKDWFVAYWLRHGVTYIRAQQTTELNQMFFDRPLTVLFLLLYQSRISSTDFPSMFCRSEVHDVKAMVSISLNRSTTAPQ